MKIASLDSEFSSLLFVLPPAVDLIKNGGFENGLAGWSLERNRNAYPDHRRAHR